MDHMQLQYTDINKLYQYHVGPQGEGDPHTPMHHHYMDIISILLQDICMKWDFADGFIRSNLQLFRDRLVGH